MILPYASTLSNICWREYSLTMDVIEKQLQWTNKVSLAWDQWASTMKLAIMLVITYYMDQNWTLGEVQLAYDEADGLLYFYSESWWEIIGQQSSYWRTASHELKEVHDGFDHTNGSLLGITTDNASANYSMTRELQSTFEATGIECPPLRHHIPRMAHIMQLALGASMSSLSAKGRTKSSDVNEHDLQFGENESNYIGMSQRLRKEGNARINKVSAMRPGLAKIIEKVCISRYSESSETDLHIAANASCVDYTDTWSLKRVHWLSNSQSANRSTTYYWSEDTVEFNNWVTSGSLPITRIRPWVAEASEPQG